MSEMLPAIAVFSIVAGMIGFLIGSLRDNSGAMTANAHPASISPQPAARESDHLPDHDLLDMKAGPTASKWKHIQCCPKCLSEIGHDEFMTEICLSCGQHMGSCLAIKQGSLRKILHGGKWVFDLFIKGDRYTFDGKNWIPFPAREARAKPSGGHDRPLVIQYPTHPLNQERKEQ